MYHNVVTMLLVFMVGVLCALGAALIFMNPNNNLKVLGDDNDYTKTNDFLRSTVQDQEEKHIKSFKKKLFENVIPAIAGNPLFAPIVETKEEVEKTSETIKALPEDQRNAICKQVCPE
jgi:hypothetical protein